MKKSTGIIVLLAAAIGAYVYFYDLKHTKATDTSSDTEEGVPSGDSSANSKPAYSLTAQDVTNLTITRAGATATFEQRADGWYMTEPVATRADQSVLGAIASELGSVRVDRTLKAAPDRIATYGLTTPAVTLDFKLKNGTQHKLQLGARDFSNLNVYADVDGAKDVALMSDTILISSDKPVDEFRDHSLLELDSNSVTSFELKNESGTIEAKKVNGSWQIEKPRAVPADPGSVSSLLGVVGTARIASFASNTPDDLAKYDLAHPPITFHAQLDSGKLVDLQLGKKDDNAYFARDPTRPFIFRVQDTLHTSLSTKFFELRDKALIHADEGDIVRAEIRNAKGDTTCVKASGGGGWIVEQPASQKTPPPACPSFWNSLSSARASDILDTPPASVTTQLAKPPVQVTLTDKSGKKIQIQISAATGDSVYARTNAGPEVLKLNRSILDDLNFTPTGIHD